MAAPIQKLARIACQCFSRKIYNDTIFKEHVNAIKSTINTITAKDLNFDPAAVPERRSERDAPVSYVHIWEDDVFSMGIFILKPGGRLPLHDHPGMFGFCKVIHGTVHVRSFTETNDQPVPENVDGRLTRRQQSFMKPAILRQDSHIGVSDGCCFLTPTEGNIHEIKAASGMSAFLDILAPPYNNQNRDCHYFKELSESAFANGNTVSDTGTGTPQVQWLMQVSQPMDYWCDSFGYFGPMIDLEG